MNKESGPKVSRRSFLRFSANGLGVVMAAPAAIQLGRMVDSVSDSPGVAYAAEAPKTESPESKYKLDWYEHFKLIDEIRVLCTDEEQLAVWDKLKADFKITTEGYAPILVKASILVEANEQREKNPLEPSIRKLARTVFLGKTDTEFVSEEDVVPFFADKNYIINIWRGSRTILEMIKKYKLEGVTFAAEFLGKLLANHLDREARIFDEEQEPEVENLEEGLLVLPDTGVKAMSAEGREKFKQHQAFALELIEDVKFLKKLPIVIRLISKEYGDVDPGRLQIMGQFRPVFGKNRKIVCEIVLNMDEIIKPEEQNPYPAKLRGHHELGHLGSIFANPYLAWFLPPKQALERYIFELQILANSDWGGSDKGIGIGHDLFTGRPHTRNNAKYVREKVYDTNHFNGYTEEYPANVIANNVAEVRYGASQTTLEKFRQQVTGSIGKDFMDIIDPKKKDLFEKFFGANKFSPDIHHFENQAQVDSAGSASILEQKSYSSLDAFWAEFKPEYEAYAKGGNLDAQIIILGLEKYQAAFGDPSGLWDGSRQPEDRYIPRPGENPEYVWRNYLQFLTFSILYDAVLNNDQRILWLLPNFLQEIVVEHFTAARRVAVAEGWAERSGFAHFLGERLNDRSTCTYLDGWKELAYILSSAR